MIGWIGKNIRKHTWKSLFSAMISFLMILFLFIYLGGLMGNRTELQNLPGALPVEGKISNVSGTRDNDILISPSKVQKLERTGMIQEVVKTASFRLDEQMSELSEEEAASRHFETTVVSANSFRAFIYIAEENITFMEGETGEALTGKEAVCFLEKGYMEEQGLSIGDRYSASIYRKEKDQWGVSYILVYACKMEAIVIGSYAAPPAVQAEVSVPQVIAPIAYVRALFREEDTPYSVNSMRFVLSDPMNMNDFKEAVKEIGFYQRDPMGGDSDEGEGLILYDESFIKTAEQLRENISLMTLFAPLVLVIVAFIGFLSAYLLMQSRTREFAIMRSVGTGRAYIFFSVLLENLVLTVLGGVLGAMLGLWLTGVGVTSALIILLIFIVCYTTGTVVALCLLNRFSVMEVLTKTDE